MEKPKSRRSGRKPRGGISGKSVMFSTRITPRTKEILDRESAAAGMSASQFFETAFLRGTQLMHCRDPIDALCQLLRAIEMQTRAHDAAGKAFDWHNDRGVFVCFRDLANRLLDHYAPAGEVNRELSGALLGVPPEVVAEKIWRSVAPVLAGKPEATSDTLKTALATLNANKRGNQ